MKSLQEITGLVRLLCLFAAASSLVACGDDSGVPEPRDTGDVDATGAETSEDAPDALDTSDVIEPPDVSGDTNSGTDEGGVSPIWQDPDDDNIPSGFDNCPDLINPGQADIDLDGVGDGCDNCERAYNPEQTDSNSDGVGDACELQTCESGLFCDAGDGLEPACCEVGQECLAGACVDLCAAGIRCDGTCCNDDELCVSATCVPLGPDCQNDGDCDYTEFCDAEVGRCLSFPDELSCQRPGEFDLFAPVEQWAWTGVEVDGVWYGNVIAVPTVADVDDDGLPEVVVAAYADSLATGVL
ncbi:MAG: hypothetical protein KGO50_09500, partial [Myxococcales bacterium]|nr:hypothetical protein [Myxococcales bacterium]